MSRTGKGLRFHPTFGWHGCWEKTQTSLSEVQDSLLLTVIARYQPCFHWLPEPQFPQGDLRRARLHLHMQSVTLRKENTHLREAASFQRVGRMPALFLRETFSSLCWKVGTLSLVWEEDIISVFQGCSSCGNPQIDRNKGRCAET